MMGKCMFMYIKREPPTASFFTMGGTCERTSAVSTVLYWSVAVAVAVVVCSVL